MGQKNNERKRKAMLKAFKRQNGRCYLCGEPMSLSNDLKDRRRATADHVIPKSKGGAIEGNIKAAHEICNTRRGSMDPEAYKRSFKNGSYTVYLTTRYTPVPGGRNDGTGGAQINPEQKKAGDKSKEAQPATSI